MTWRTTTLGELCDEGGGSIQTGPFGSQLHAADYVTHGIPSVMPQNIGDNVIDPDGIARIADADATRLGKYLLASGDIVYSRRGDVERRAFVRPENDGWLCGTGCLRVRLGPGSSHDSLFLSYYLGTEDARAWIVRHAVGATMPNLNTGILAAVPVRVPEPHVQTAIAEVLGALDDKIAANTSLGSVADEVVRAQYTRISAVSREATTIGDLATHPRSLVDPTKLDPMSLYVGLEHVPRRLMWLDDSGSADAVTSTKASFSRGDVLFGKLRPYFHKVVSAPSDGICSTDILVVRPSKSELAGFVLAAASSDATVERCTAASEGTRMPRTSWKDLAAIEVPWPNESEAQTFSADVDVLRRRIEAAVIESRTLAQVRDALLPQLMSGKIKVKDAERVVEGVV